jgi:hypothetical protein
VVGSGVLCRDLTTVATEKEGKMAINRLLFITLVGAAVGLLTATAVAQAPPAECTTMSDPANGNIGIGNGNWTIEVTQGPCPVSCSYRGTGKFCDSGTDCTGIEYTITENGRLNADHLVTLVRDVDVVYTAGEAFAVCEGDSVTGAGENECHERAVRLNDSKSVKQVNRLVVDGAAQTIATSVILKAGKKVEACRIQGLGVDTTLTVGGCVPSCGGFDPDQTLTKTEVLEYKGCAVEFTFSLATGELLSAVLTPESVANDCDFHEGFIGQLELLVNGENFGVGNFGDGTISTGTNSCTCRMIGGRWMCWGYRCPN